MRCTRTCPSKRIGRGEREGKERKEEEEEGDERKQEERKEESREKVGTKTDRPLPESGDDRGP